VEELQSYRNDTTVFKDNRLGLKIIVETKVWEIEQILKQMLHIAFLIDNFNYEDTRKRLNS
jgi:hypothetical protein